MKKTITVNLGGTVFAIDEDAYELLKEYLERIENHFPDEKEKSEIMADIEARIAELLTPGQSPRIKPVTISDVEGVISVMGNPEDIAEDAGVEGDDPSGASGGKGPGAGGYAAGGSRRIYRDVDNRLLGGVCSGIAAYWNIDVVWIRIIFVILTLGALSGVFIYLILWLVVPPAVTTAQKLEMRGEPVNISSIGRAVKDEFESVRKNLKI